MKGLEDKIGTILNEFAKFRIECEGDVEQAFSAGVVCSDDIKKIVNPAYQLAIGKIEALIESEKPKTDRDRNGNLYLIKLLIL